MSRRIPDIEDLIAGEADPRERDRLARVHAALGRSGPLPELPSSLERPRLAVVRAVRPAQRRHRRLRVALAAAIAAAAMAAAGVVAYLGTSGGGESGRLVAMHPTPAAPMAHATLRIGAPDHLGNWPVTLSVRGLPRLPAGSYYEMFLTDRGRLVGACGTFRADPGTTVVRLNVPFALGEYSGWVIRREPAGRHPGLPLLAT
jgi:hypothetical protein